MRLKRTNEAYTRSIQKHERRIEGELSTPELSTQIRTLRHDVDVLHRGPGYAYSQSTELNTALQESTLELSAARNETPAAVAVSASGDIGSTNTNCTFEGAQARRRVATGPVAP